MEVHRRGKIYIMSTSMVIGGGREHGSKNPIWASCIYLAR